MTSIVRGIDAMVLEELGDGLDVQVGEVLLKHGELPRALVAPADRGGLGEGRRAGWRGRPRNRHRCRTGRADQASSPSVSIRATSMPSMDVPLISPRARSVLPIRPFLCMFRPT